MAACSCMAAMAICATIRSNACLRDVRVHQILEGTNEMMRHDRQPRLCSDN